MNSLPTTTRAGLVETVTLDTMPEEGGGKVDLEKAKHQHVQAVGPGESQQLYYMHGEAIIYLVEQGLKLVVAAPGGNIPIVEVRLGYRLRVRQPRSL